MTTSCKSGSIAEILELASWKWLKPVQVDAESTKQLWKQENATVDTRTQPNFYCVKAASVTINWCRSSTC